jgi:hypothetical protein
MIFNESVIDRTVRVLLGSLILLQFFIHPASPYRHWALIGLMPILTGLIGYCPAYRLFDNKLRSKNSVLTNDAEANKSTDR